jgi:hypothetical protein
VLFWCPACKKEFMRSTNAKRVKSFCCSTGKTVMLVRRNKQ